MDYSRYYTLALVCLAALWASSLQALTIDRFTVVQTVTDFAGGTGTVDLASDSDAIGGTRAILVQTNPPSGFITSVVGTNAYSHSQSAPAARGFSRVTWDGDSVIENLNIGGLGAIDMTQDGATALRVGIDGYDAPGQFVVITVTLYDQADPLGNIFSAYSFNLQGQAGLPFVAELPFSNPSAVGIGGAANVQNIGAIVLTVDGGAAESAAADVTLGYLGTNGQCDLIPVNGRVIDECGVCGGDNSVCSDCNGVPNGGAEYDVCEVCGGDGTSCLDCAGTPFGDAVLDICEVCGGDGTSCLDCSGTPNGNAVFDQCGMCGGDSSSCADCAGIPNGNASLDLCGVCGGNNSSCTDCAGTPLGTKTNDLCGVCGGDNTSCLGCSTSNITDLLQTLDNGAKEQEEAISKALYLLRKQVRDRATRTYIRQTAMTAHELQITNWQLTWFNPTIVTTCSNTVLCETVSLENSPIWETYRKNALALRNLGLDVVAKLKKSKAKANAARRLIEERYQKYSDLSLQVPLSGSSCNTAQ